MRTACDPPAARMMLPGLMSRWMTPASCSACAASATCRTISTTWGIRPWPATALVAPPPGGAAAASASPCAAATLPAWAAPPGAAA